MSVRLCLSSLPVIVVSLLTPIAAGQEEEALQTHRNMGKAHYERGEYDPAVREFEAVLETERALARDYFNAGMAYLQNGQEDRALAAFATARQMDPGMVEVSFGLGILYKRQLRYPAALASFEQVARHDPEDPCTWFNIGAVAFSMQRVEEAERAFQTVLSMGYPRGQNFYVSALFRYASLLARKGQQEQAQKLFDEFGALRDKTPNVSLTPSALENGYYARIEPPLAPTSEGTRPAPVRPAFEELSRLRLTEPDCEADSEREMALGDYDRDGLVDVFITSPCGANRLVRNEGGGQLSDVTERAGLASSRRAVGAVFLDYDNSGFASLFVLGGEGNRLYANRDGRFRDVSDESGLAGDGSRPGSSAVAFDYDNDGQLDLFLAGLAGSEEGGPTGLKLYRNNGDGTFRDRSREAGLTAFDDARPRGAAAADFDEDGFTDLFVVTEGRGAILLSNVGSGSFRRTNVSLEGRSEGRRAARVEVSDFNRDGRFDVFVVDEKGYSLVVNRGGELTELAGLPAARPRSARAAVAVDADGDGGTDFLLQDTEGRFLLLANRSPGIFESIPIELPPVPLTVAAAADLDGRGATQLVVAGVDGSLRVDQRSKPAQPTWLRIHLEGRRTNRQGVGAVVEIKAGRFYQKHRYPGRPVTLYTGTREHIDVVRVTWSNGVIQNEVGVRTGQTLHIEESEQQTSSCPFLYVWDGSRFRFLTDVVGRAPLGEILPGGGLVAPNPEDYVRIPPGTVHPSDGGYVFQITEELRELAYIDAVELLAVDHPAGVEVYTNEKFSAPPFEPFRLYSVARKWAPRKASNGRNEDVRPELSDADGWYEGSFSRLRIPGFAEEHEIVLEPGRVDSARPLWLFLTGWVYWPSSSSMKAIAEHGRLRPRPPALQVKDVDGKWKTVMEDLGLPSGINRTLVADLTGKFLSEDRAVRIVTNFAVYWDQAFFATAAETVMPPVDALQPDSAHLHYRGFSTPARLMEVTQPESYDYSRMLPQPPWNAANGRYTRYGDVRDLLGAADDRMVVMAPGDEMSVRFETGALPPPPQGFERDFVLHVTGWAKDNDPNTVYSRTVGPLPYRRMVDYSQATAARFLESEAGRRYLAEYQTRSVPILVAPLAPPYSLGPNRRR